MFARLASTSVFADAAAHSRHQRGRVCYARGRFPVSVKRLSLAALYTVLNRERGYCCILRVIATGSAVRKGRSRPEASRTIAFQWIIRRRDDGVTARRPFI